MSDQQRVREKSHIPLFRLFSKQAQVGFEYGLKKAHVGALIETNLVLP